MPDSEKKAAAPDLSACRAEIDRIDKEFLRLFAERMDVCARVAEYKAGRGLPVFDAEREKAKLDSVAASVPSRYGSSARELYETVFRLSREYQERLIGEMKLRCGLLGKKLGHSYSKPIHALLGAYSYDYFEKEESEVAGFVSGGGWDGLNVTIPYKKNAAALADVLSDAARATGSVNTLVRRDGIIFGYNTDVAGFTALVRRSGADSAGRHALVLGSGGASRAVVYALESLGARVTVISRSGENNYGNLDKNRDASIIVNATPVGMFPDNGRSPIDLSLFPALCGVFDLIYNPSRTAFLAQAEKFGVPAFGGLYMLVAQAAASYSLFTGNPVPDGTVAEIAETVERETSNLILIGMPGCGKTATGQALALKLGREFIDCDRETEKLLGMPIPDFLRERGECAFRDAETEALKNVCRLSGKIIATGGGCVTRPENRDILRQNGKTVLLLRDLARLSSEGRPLSREKGVERLFAEREPLYRAFADVTVEVKETGGAEGTAGEIIKLLGLK
ncbi:MAG: chorismate mutase [Clostridia bacterium]|nr:chorismate mutase [Clostridia bacterium]MBP5270108.1 chorismate mutase [Clostridia bacterium]